MTCFEFSLCPFCTMEYISDYYPIPPPFTFHALILKHNVPSYLTLFSSCIIYLTATYHNNLHILVYPKTENQRTLFETLPNTGGI